MFFPYFFVNFATQTRNVMRTNCKIFALLALVSVCSCSYESRDERLKHEAEAFTATKCPMGVDKCTTIDSMVFNTSTRELAYHYTLFGEIDHDSLFTDELRETFKSNVVNELKGSISMRQYKEAEVTFVYDYRSKKTGKEYLRIIITPEEYR